MSAQSAGISGKTFTGKKHNNSNPFVKIKIREWLIQQMDNPQSILDIYGGHGLMFKKVWSRFPDYSISEGDAVKWLKQQELFKHDIFDIDPYGSPYEALLIISEKAEKNIIGLVCTDGALRFEAKIRGKLPKILLEKCKWDGTSRTLKAAIYYQYPKYLRFALKKLMPDWTLEKLAIKVAVGQGKSGTVYWAGLFSRK